MSIGLIIGVERERRLMGTLQPMGVRSFLLISLLGALAGNIDQPLIAVGLVFFAIGATLLGYVRATRVSEENPQPIGLTTEIAAIATFTLGYLCNREPILSLALGMIMFLVLSNKTFLHRWTKEKLKPNELQAAATLLLLAVGIIPIMPDHTVDPFKIFNPRRLGVIISLIAAIQFLGYAAARVFGHRIGMALSGFLAGNISSTAAFASYPKLAKEGAHGQEAIASAAAFAFVASISQLLVLLSAISWPLALSLLWPLMLLIISGIIIGIFLSRKNKKGPDKKYLGKPLNLWSAIKLGILLMALIFIVELSQRFAGDALTKIVAFLGALFELQGVGVAAANMFENQSIGLSAAAHTIMLAVVASIVSKFGLTLILAKGIYRTLTLRFSGFLMILTIFLCAMLYMWPALLPVLFE
jgi:uncharacterized membrane protein (DUF4010 family)